MRVLASWGGIMPIEARLSFLVILVAFGMVAAILLGLAPLN